eukprot:scaffold10239_cov122-Isochrysis_galbana.AAC.1
MHGLHRQLEPQARRCRPDSRPRQAPHQLPCKKLAIPCQWTPPLTRCEARAPSSAATRVPGARAGIGLSNFPSWAPARAAVAALCSGKETFRTDWTRMKCPTT